MVTKINKELSVQVKRLAHYQDLPFPSYATIHSSGLDLLSTEDLTLKPLQRCLVPTGLQIAIPVGYEGQVRPRSGLALKHGLTVVNTPGTIDADYRGEVCVILANLSTTDYEIKRGMRIAQLVFASVAQAELLPVEELPTTSRGTGGFGSTGVL